MLLYCTSITPRLQYIVDFIGKELRTGDIQITSSVEQFTNYTGTKINYSDQRIDSGGFWLRPHPLLFETGVKQQNTECFEVNGNKAFFKTEGDLPFDLFAASFYLLSRYEEYLPHNKDMYGRYGFENSLAFREKFLDMPLVNLWLKDFSSLLKTKFPPSSPPPGSEIPVPEPIEGPDSRLTFLPTYDIDIAWSYKHKGWWRNTGGFLRSCFKGDWSLAKERLRVLRGKQMDPFDAFGWMNKLHEQYEWQCRRNDWHATNSIQCNRWRYVLQRFWLYHWIV